MGEPSLRPTNRLCPGQAIPAAGESSRRCAGRLCGARVASARGKPRLPRVDCLWRARMISAADESQIRPAGDGNELAQGFP